MTAARAPLPLHRTLAYGALGLPLAMAALPMYVYLPQLYAQAGGMSLGLLGAFSVWALPTAMQMYRYQ